jgi:hypothetical protein
MAGTARQGAEKGYEVILRGWSKKCRLSWLTNSALVFQPKCGGGVGLRGLSQ